MIVARLGATRWAVALGMLAACAFASPMAFCASSDEPRHVHGHDEAGSTPEALAERRRLMADGESRLAQGDVEGARSAFEQAALQVHDAHIELGILRTQMQAGQYRQALAFAAHTAGVHLDEVDGKVFYAWLLSLGGQVAVAEQTLKQAEASAPDHPMVKEARQRFDAGVLIAHGALLSLPGRLAPFASGAVVRREASMAGTALLLADGRHALAPCASLPTAGVIWLRNGLGQTVTAKVEEQDDVLGVALLSLSSPLPQAGGEIVPPLDAFSGSPAFAIDYPIDPAAQAAWPVLRAGFLGTPSPGSLPSTQRLGVELPGRGPRGGPVYDQSGRLVGLALGNTSGGPTTASTLDRADSMIKISALRHRFGERFGHQTVELRLPQVGADELYERAMKTSLQMLIASE